MFFAQKEKTLDKEFAGTNPPGTRVVAVADSSDDTTPIHARRKGVQSVTGGAEAAT